MAQNNRPIGLFDSGVGGLTVMREIVRSLPNENLIYFGDTARIPYGSKSPETICRYSIENTIFLLEKDIKLLVIACNTASAHALKKLKQIFNIPIIDVINPGAQKAAAVTKKGRIGILATKGTTQSKAYETEILGLLPEAQLTSIACPLFVPLVEENLIHHPATRLMVHEYLKPLKEKQIDTLLLGCTHYPLLKELIRDELGSNIEIVDSADSCAQEVAKILSHLNICGRTEGQQRYYVSDDPKKFHELGSSLFNIKIEHIQKINT